MGMRNTLLLGRVASVLLLGAVVWCSVVLHRIEHGRGRMKTDVKEVSHVTYGLFNVDAWRVVLADIITKKVSDLHVSEAQREHLREHLKRIMYQLLDEAEAVVEQRNKRSGFKGMMRQLILDIFVDLKTIRSGVPRYADLMIDYVNDPENRGELTHLVLEQFDSLAVKTAGEIDYAELNDVMARWGCRDKDLCKAYLQGFVDEWSAHSARWLAALALAIAASLALVLLRRGQTAVDQLFLVGVALCLLVTGVTLPMIDIEATISEFSFTLMGEPVLFTDQVVFFQSKSILQVVEVLLTDGDASLAVVGVLVLLFSVIMPMAKIVASLITLHSGRPPQRKLHAFLVFRAGKWSMADVMVVAIFMAFIGFSGIVGSQLEQLEGYTSAVEILTTNNSQLQVGFYLFLGYCLLGLLLGARIERLMKERLPQSANGAGFTSGRR